MKNIKSKITLLIFAFGFASQISAQEIEKKEDWGIKFTGFIKSDYWLDTRINYSSREGLFLFYPENRMLDETGIDINNKPNFNFSAMTSRLIGNINGPDAFNAKTSGTIESDFSGVSNNDINGLRLRHAYLKLKWENDELLLGQYWHPMFTIDVFPEVVSLNTGAPFNPFNRSPQITYYKTLSKVKIINSFITQRDNSNLGPQGYSPDYMRNAIIPNYNFQLIYKSEKIIIGFFADYKILMPKLINSMNYKTSETIDSYSFSIFGKYTNNSFCVKSKSIFGQNLTEHLMMGGYAVSNLDTITGVEKYTITNHIYSWINLYYNIKDLRISLFTGYLKNLGTSEQNIGIYYSRGNEIDQIYRLAPSVTYNFNKLSLAFEWENTNVSYGLPNSLGIIHNKSLVSNQRFIITSMYYF